MTEKQKLVLTIKTIIYVASGRVLYSLICDRKNKPKILVLSAAVKTILQENLTLYEKENIGKTGKSHSIRRVNIGKQENLTLYED